MVQATPQGLQRVEQLAPAVQAHYRQLEQQLGKERLAQLYELLDALIALEERR